MRVMAVTQLCPLEYKDRTQGQKNITKLGGFLKIYRMEKKDE